MVVKKQTRREAKPQGFSWVGTPSNWMGSHGDMLGKGSNTDILGLRKPIGNAPTNPLWISAPGDRNLGWKQLKRKYPGMNPYGDYDGDLFFNSKDCKPLNPNEDGILAAIAGARRIVQERKWNGLCWLEKWNEEDRLACSYSDICCPKDKTEIGKSKAGESSK